MKYLSVVLALGFAVAAVAQKPTRNVQTRAQDAMFGAERLNIENYESPQQGGHGVTYYDILLTNRTDEEVEYQISTRYGQQLDSYRRLTPNASHSIRYVADPFWGNPFITYRHKPGGAAVEKVLGNHRAFEFLTDSVGVIAKEAGPLNYEITVTNKNPTEIKVWAYDCGNSQSRVYKIPGHETIAVSFEPSAQCDTPKLSFYHGSGWNYRTRVVQHFAVYEFGTDRSGYIELYSSR